MVSKVLFIFLFLDLEGLATLNGVDVRCGVERLLKQLKWFQFHVLSEQKQKQNDSNNPKKNETTKEIEWRFL